ncbi:Coenzyme F420:L-glutamate ligase [uncultured archaeon]|nr:Coenzyme F420:L-glutamate ligase [uncultured archaeon]
MDVLEAVRNRCAVRQFKPEIITEDIIRKILEAGRWAPSPFNTQPWDFIIIKNKETLKAIARFARYSGYLEDAPMAIAVVVPPVSGKFSWVESIGETRFAAAMAVQNMMLEAWELGIGSCWVSIERDKVAEILKVPDNCFVLTVIPLGYPEIAPQKHNENSRKKLEQMISYENYGRRANE